MYSKECLVGRKVVSVHYDKGRGIVVFVFSDGEKLACYAEEDCCSRSWIQHITGSDQLVGLVTAVQEIGLPAAIPSPSNEVEVEAIYGIKICTDRSYGLIELRNDSNGYYGGYYGGWLRYEKWTEEKLPPRLEDF